jgi:hypothetical protein
VYLSGLGSRPQITGFQGKNVVSNPGEAQTPPQVTGDRPASCSLFKQSQHVTIVTLDGSDPTGQSLSR